MRKRKVLATGVQLCQIRATMAATVSKTARIASNFCR
jgi:hypothetical protein